MLQEKSEPEKKKHKASPEDDYYKKIGELSNFINNTKVESELQGYAVEYTILMVGTLAEEAYRILGPSTIKEKGQALNIKELDRTFKSALPGIRNGLADDFHRIQHNHHKELLTHKGQFGTIAR